MNQSNEIWPPPPTCAQGAGEEGKHLKRRLLTGATWTDAILACVASIIVFSLLTFTLFNPVAASVLSSVPDFPSGPRLLIGWTLAGIVNTTGWAFFRQRRYFVISNGVLGASALLASVWLFLIVMAWLLFS